MEQSAEVRDLVLRSYEALLSGDQAFFEQHLSPQDGVLVIGTDPNEWWADYATITRVFKIQMEEMGQISISQSNLQAYREGNVGWAADRAIFSLPGDVAFPIRLTMVCHKEQGDWKIVQWHASAGVANEDVLGKQLTTE